MLSEQGQKEWEAWQRWHKEFTALTGLSINDSKCEKFVEATKGWADALIMFRTSEQKDTFKRIFDKIEEATNEDGMSRGEAFEVLDEIQWMIAEHLELGENEDVEL